MNLPLTSLHSRGGGELSVTRVDAGTIYIFNTVVHPRSGWPVLFNVVSSGHLNLSLLLGFQAR
jgi:hypothetical protein